MAEQVKSSKAKDGVYILVILILLAGAGYLGYMVSERNKSLSTCEKETQKLETELAEINDLFSQSEIELVSDDLKTNLENMMSQYNNMEASNTMMQDSLNSQKERIATLMEQVEKHKGDARMIYKLRKEAATLREIMKGYIRTIDSLNRENQTLRTDLQNTNQELGDVKTERDKYKDITSELETKVSEGARIVASGFSNKGLKIRGSGKQVEVDKANRTDMILSCFTLGRNPIAKTGKKNVYLRIIAPDGTVLHRSATNSIKLSNGVNVMYSDKKQVDYNGSSIDVCIYYDLDGKEAPKGTYIIEAYADAARIGKSQLVLR